MKKKKCKEKTEMDNTFFHHLSHLTCDTTSPLTCLHSPTHLHRGQSTSGLLQGLLPLLLLGIGMVPQKLLDGKLPRLVPKLLSCLQCLLDQPLWRKRRKGEIDNRNKKERSKETSKVGGGGGDGRMMNR